MLKLVFFILVILFVLQNIKSQHIEKFSPSSLRITNINYYPCSNSTCNQIRSQVYNLLKSSYASNFNFSSIASNSNTNVYDGKIDFITNIKTNGTTKLVYTGTYFKTSGVSGTTVNNSTDITNTINLITYFLRDHRVLNNVPIKVEFRGIEIDAATLDILPIFVSKINKLDRFVKFYVLPYESNIKQIKIYIYLNNNGYILYETDKLDIFRTDIYSLIEIVENFISSLS